jgi:hypothetical protein
MRALVLAAAMLGGACQPRTELVVGIISDLPVAVGSGLDAVAIDARRDDVPVVQATWPLDGPLLLPGSFGLYSPDGSPTSLAVIVTGFKANKILMVRTARVSLASNQTLFMRMGLASACESAIKTCPMGQTCIDGTCLPPDVVANRLPAYRPELVDTVECESGPRWVDSGGGPLPIGAGCPAGMICREGTCYVAPP